MSSTSSTPDAPAKLERAQAQLAQLRDGESPAGPLDLSELCLAGLDLSGLELAGADLSRSDLSRAKLGDANLFGAKLVQANLYEADLEGAELSAADLSGVRAEKANLASAGLGSASLEGALLTLADLSGATLTEARVGDADLRSANLRGARMLDADLRGADLSKSDLRQADLRRSCVERARFRGADLREARPGGMSGFQGADWVGADVRHVDPTGARVWHRFVMDQNFIEEFRLQSLWSQIVYRVWYVTSDCGRSVVRWSFWTTVLVLVFAWAYTFVGVDYGDHPTPISPLYFSVVTMTTLGFGDVTPSTIGGQVVTMIQVVTGYVMLGGLLSIFNTKMASRAD